jgi:hypothetical protein
LRVTCREDEEEEEAEEEEEEQQQQQRVTSARSLECFLRIGVL